MKFKNPVNGRIENVKNAFLWCLLFGPFYLFYKHAWLHAIIAIFLILLGKGLAWLIYPFFAHGIAVKRYRQKGWEEIWEN